MCRLPRNCKRAFCATTVTMVIVAVAAVVQVRTAAVRADFTRRDVSSLRGPLTGQSARAALGEMLAKWKQMDPALTRAPASHLEQIDLTGLARAKVKQNPDGTCSVDAFFVDAKARSYLFETGNRCRYRWLGSFERKQGQWIATLPQWDAICCYK
jgi:hypothetical protein